MRRRRRWHHREHGEHGEKRNRKLCALSVSVVKTHLGEFMQPSQQPNTLGYVSLVLGILSLALVCLFAVAGLVEFIRHYRK